MAKSNRPALAWACATLMLNVGCGGEFQLANVSGVVKLDGEPLQNATVYFQPQRHNGAVLVGPPSVGVTDSEGRFTLNTTSGSSGAVVGTHVISVSTFESRMVDPLRSDRVEVVSKERVPRRYRAPSELSFTVPRGGAEDAVFDLSSDGPQ